MVFPLWRSLYSLNLMLPKEERRAMLLRIFNDNTPLVNTTGKRDAAASAATAAASETPTEPESAANMDIDDDDVDTEEGGVLLATTGKEEEQAIQKESPALGEQEDGATKTRQSFVAAENEDVLMNKRV